MKAYSSVLFPLPLPEGHRFPMRKYSRVREVLLEDGILEEREILDAPLATAEDLARVHDPEYVRRVAENELTSRELRRLGFPWSPELVRRAHASVGASLAAARAALVEGFGANLAGGTHHAFRDAASGYCVFNDFAVVAATLLHEGAASRILIVDLDVHQGNGTAVLMKDEPRVFTLSLHGADNFPYRKETSDLDVALPTGTGDEAYLAALDGALAEARARFGTPDLVLYLAGADPHEDDRFGRLRLTVEGLARRDARVFEEFAPEIPIAAAMGGGYGRDVEVVARIHAATIAAGKRAYAARRVEVRI
jgi:acetoin utilization deacetylase AcuC-like enzyme